MRRLAWMIVVVSLALPLVGCAGGPAKEEREPFTESRWREMIKEDQRRALPERENSIALLVQGIKDTIAILMGEPPFNAAKALLDPSFAEKRRKAIVYLADRTYGRKEPYTIQYENMAVTDDEALVRATALRALNRARAKKATPVFIQALEARDVAMRLEAAKALANIPDAAAVPKLIRRMNDPEEHADVRIAAADALRNYRTAEVAQALVGTLRGQFSVAWQARQSLKLMTGRDFRFDRTGWLNYLSGAQRPFG